MRALRILADVRVEYAGLGLLVSWVYCCWFSPALFGVHDRATHDDMSWLISMAASVATIFAASRLLGARSLSEVRGAYALCGTLVSAGTFCMAADFGVNFNGFIMVGGSLATGICSGLLYVMWSEYMATLREGEVRAAASFASVVAFCSFLAAWVLPAGFSVLFVSALPLASVAFFARAFDSVRARAHSGGTCEGAAQDASYEKTGSSLVARVFTVAAVVSAIAAFGWATAPSFPGVNPERSIFFGAIGGMALALLVSLTSYFMRSSPNIARLYRILIPLLVIALGLLEVRPVPPSGIAMALLIALGMGFDFFLLMYFGSLLASRFPNAKRAFCYCEAFTNVGLFAGNAVGVMLGRISWVTPTLLGNIYLGLIAVSVLVLVVAVEQQGNVDRMMAPGSRDEVVARVAESFGLTARECEILGFLARGRSVPFISEVLFIQKSTVETHRKHIYSKLKVHNRQELLDLIDALSV